jgi:hypothetical protein
MVVFLLGSGAEDDLFVMFEDRLLDTQPASYVVASPRTAIALLNNGCHTPFRASYFVMLRRCKKLTECADLIQHSCRCFVDHDVTSFRPTFFS